MDANAVSTAAIYGAIGGGFGALLGTMIAALFRNTKHAVLARAAFGAGLAVLGMNLARPILEPYIGEYLPKSEIQKTFDEQFEEVVAELNSYPLTAAILERDPSLKGELRSKLEAISKEATTGPIARQMAFAAGYNVVIGKLTHYLPRATDEDMIGFLNVTVETLEGLELRDPHFCFDYLYNPAAMATLDSGAVKQKIGAALFDRQQDVSAALIRNAYRNIPGYDVVRANAALQEVAKVFQNTLGDKIGLVTGQMYPADDAEARLACGATAALYGDVAAREDAVLVGRHIFAQTAS